MQGPSLSHRIGSPMSEQAFLVFGAVAGLFVFGAAVSIGALALALGRPLRAHGRARIGEAGEFSVGVEVPGTPPRKRRRDSD